MQDPVEFAQRWLGAKPWTKQRQILRALRDNRQVAVRSCNASGKTYTAALATIWWLMAHEEALVITTAPSERQVKNTLWREIRAIHEQNKELIGGKLTSTRLELSNKCFAYGFSTNTAERFQGFHSENILLIVDEASGVHEFIFEAILGLMTSRNAKILMIGNPSSLAGTFYDAFHKNRKHWKTIHIAATDTPNFNPRHSARSRHSGESRNPEEHEQGAKQPLSHSERGASKRGDASGVCPEGSPPLREARGTRASEARTQGVPTPAIDDQVSPVNGGNVRGLPRTPIRRTKGTDREGEDDTPTYIPGLATPEWANSVLELKGERSASYQIRVLGEFPDEADDTLIPLKHIENAVEKLFEDIDRHEAVMGLDVARFGDDQTVAIVRRGPAVVELAAHRKSDLMHTTGRALEIGRTHNIKTINVDEVGLGSAVVDRIEELNKSNELTDIKAIGINGGNRSTDTERFFNLRTQMFDGLRQRFADGEISIPNDPELISQLASITYHYNSRGQLQIESKQQIRESGRQSPDKADALALAFTTPHEPELKMWIGTPKKTEHLLKRRRTRHNQW